MAIATLVYYCSKCDIYQFQPGICPVCHSMLDTKALIDAYELKQLIHKLTTPEGIVRLVTALKAWLGG